MKTTLKFLMYLCISFSLALPLVSCEGEDGMDGAQGPQGEQGPAGRDGIDGQDGRDGVDGQDGQDGQDGRDGQDGEDGEDGNAEVIYSAWIPANFTGTSSSVKFMDIKFPPELPSAASIRNTHVILVFFTGFGDGSTYLLPILNFRGAQFTYGYGSGSANVDDIFIRAQALSGDLNEFQIDPARGNRFRYVIIPPNIPVGKSAIDYSDYEAVKRAFGIKD